MSFSIRPAEDRDWQALRQLLDAAELPTSDLSAERMGDFLVAESARGDPVGCIGIECYGSRALLRSLVISPHVRDAGIGRALVERLEAAAVGRGIREVWLLTNDAAGYFALLGYLPRERSEVPAAIRQTREFAALCPDSATLMSRTLGRAHT